MRWTLPNIITLARILITPVIALLPVIEQVGPDETRLRDAVALLAELVEATRAPSDPHREDS